MKIIHNPRGVRDQLIECLNQCYPDWGGVDAYSWSFEARGDFPQADWVVAVENDKLIAGSAINYRTFELSSGSRCFTGIVTTSWTLPEARGKGCFSALYERSVTLSSSRGAALLFGYVTSKNASYRRVAARGAQLAPSSYLFTTDATRPQQLTQDLEIVEMTSQAETETMFAELYRASAGKHRFAYKNYAQWRSQLIARALHCRCVRIGNVGKAVIEYKPPFQRVLALSAYTLDAVEKSLSALINAALQINNRVFLFTMDPDWRDISLKLGMECLPGYLTISLANKDVWESATKSASVSDTSLPTNLEQLETNWSVHTGDRM